MLNEKRAKGCLGLCIAAMLVAGCEVPEPREPSAGHISAYPQTQALAPAADIPTPVQATPYLPPPRPEPPAETYTVVVNEVPVKELLFALARDAKINVDIHPDIEGLVTLNAINQTLPQILDRLSRQIDMRYEVQENSLEISPDLPFWRIYRVDYVNMARDSTTSVSATTRVASTGGDPIGGGGGGGGGANTSDTTITNTSNNRFWETLTQNVITLLGDGAGAQGGAGPENSVIVNPETGVMSIRASASQHGEVQAFLDQVLSSAQRQVLIEATIVEVQLNDNYQTGIDWSVITDADDDGVSVVQDLSRLTDPAALTGVLRLGDFTAVVDLLTEFGDVSVMSSPKLMAINNQTSILKVVDNEVYFTLELDERDNEDTGTLRTRIESTVNTVAIGLIMNITPQINANDSVILNVRPTITRIADVRNDPGAQIIAQATGFGGEVINQIPVVTVRETETVLRVNSGQTAVIGGLMQDTVNKNTDGIPVLSDLPGVGEVFRSRNNAFVKTELVIFMRPIVIKNPSLDADFANFRQFLPENKPRAEPATSMNRGLLRDLKGMVEE